MNLQATTPFMLLRRTAAILYDCLLLVAVFFIITGIVVGLNEGEATQHPLYYLLLYVVGFLFYLICWKLGGQTLGMKAWHLKLISTTGMKLTSRQCLLRYLLSTLAFGFTYLHAVFDRDRLSLHDRLAGTRIIKSN